MIVRAHVSLFGLLAIPSSGTNRYPASVATYSRRGQLEAPDGRVVYVRMVDSAESSLSSLLTDTSGSALASSSNASFPSSAGWRVVEAGSVEGVFAFEVAVGSAQSAAQGRLDVGYRSESESMQTAASFAISGSASVDLSVITDEIGASTDDIAATTLHGRINAVRDDIAGLTDPGTIAATLGTPTAAETVTALLEVPILAHGTVTTATGTGTVTSTAFIGRDLALELLIIEDVSAGMTPPLRCSRTIASFNPTTGACTVATLNFSPAVGDKVWVVPRAQTAP